MNPVNMAEILIVNCIGVILMVFLRLTRIENIEKRFAGDILFDLMIWITIAGCSVEMLTFVIDGRIFPFCRELSYLLNSFCFIGTCDVGFLWCLYVDFRVFNNAGRVRRRAKFLVIPFVLDVLLNLVNMSGCGIIFTVSEDNVYHRGSLVLVVYVILFFYFIYSICLVDHSKKSGLHIQFLPVYYFVVPCMLGTIIQGVVYGVTVGWTSVAVALLFVYIETQSRNTFVDALSGLYNRRYMDCILSQFKRSARQDIYGIMIDVNDFKRINDVYGHSKGDDAIRNIGKILSNSVPDNGMVIRYAGDEFIIFLRTDDEETVKKTIQRVEVNTEKFNKSHAEPYVLSFAMGYSRFDASSEDVEKFLSAMDEKMYIAKREHYQQAATDRRKNRIENRGA